MYVKQYFVYILSNYYKTTLYVGCTNHIISRLKEHQAAFEHSKRFTHRYNCTKLLYYEIYLEKRTAFQRERQIKRYRREKKEVLINTQNPSWMFLNESVQKTHFANPARKKF